MNVESNPEISVVIPVKNGEKTLPVALNAIFRSREKAVETIVVDDHSTDRTAEIALQYAVRYIRMEGKHGSGNARNEGSRLASAPIILHTDADVELQEDTLTRILERFSNDPSLAALFGSYNLACPCEDFFSQYKNMHHHWVHQNSRREASTFWTGCGAVRREIFNDLGGFRTSPFIRQINDIDFGYRLRKKGLRIELDQEIQVTHHKRYDFRSVIRSDLVERAIPWTRIMIDNRIFLNDLNTGMTGTMSVCLVCGSLLLSLFPFPLFTRTAILVGSLGITGFLNRGWWRFCRRKKGVSFAFRAMWMEFLYYLTCGTGLIAGGLLSLSHFLSRRPGR